MQEENLLPRKLNGCSVLDLGAGSGNGAIALKKKGARIQAVEASQIIVDDVIKRGDLTPAEIRQGNVPPVLDEYREREFDLITAFGATLPIEPVLHKGARILKKGGKIVITTHYGNLETLERLNRQINNPEATLNQLGYRSGEVKMVNIGVFDDPYCLVIEKIK